MNTDKFLERLRAEGLIGHPVPPPRPDEPLAAGQIRRLDPWTDEAGQSRLVLLLDDPEEMDFPEDVTFLPGPARIIHVVPVHSMEREFTTDELELVGCTEFPAFISVGLYSTIRLGSDTGNDRFGPPVGTDVPKDLAEILRMSCYISRADLSDHLSEAGFLGTTVTWGELQPQMGDNAWHIEVMECRNINMLTGW